MEGVGLPEKAKPDQRSLEKRIVEDNKTRRWRLQMEELGSYEALSIGDESGGRSQWSGGHSSATHAPTRGGQVQEKDTRITTRGSSIVGVLAFDG